MQFHTSNKFLLKIFPKTFSIDKTWGLPVNGVLMFELDGDWKGVVGTASVVKDTRGEVRVDDLVIEFAFHWCCFIRVWNWVDWTIVWLICRVELGKKHFFNVHQVSTGVIQRNWIFVSVWKGICNMDLIDRLVWFDPSNCWFWLARYACILFCGANSCIELQFSSAECVLFVVWAASSRLFNCKCAQKEK